MVDFKPVARWQNGKQVTFHSDNPTRTLFVSTRFVKFMGLRLTWPQPAATQALENGLLLTFGVPPGMRGAIVRLMLQPSGIIGLQHLEARLEDRSTLGWTQLGLP